MDIYEVDLEPAEPEGLAATIPALPGLLVLGSDVDDVPPRVRVAIAFHAGCGLFPIRLAVSRLPQSPTLRHGQRDLHACELVGDRSGLA